MDVPIFVKPKLSKPVLIEEIAKECLIAARTHLGNAGMIDPQYTKPDEEEKTHSSIEYLAVIHPDSHIPDKSMLVAYQDNVDRLIAEIFNNGIIGTDLEKLRNVITEIHKEEDVDDGL